MPSPNWAMHVSLDMHAFCRSQYMHTALSIAFTQKLESFCSFLKHKLTTINKRNAQTQSLLSSEACLLLTLTVYLCCFTCSVSSFWKPVRLFTDGRAQNNPHPHPHTLAYLFLLSYIFCSYFNICSCIQPFKLPHVSAYCIFAIIYYRKWSISYIYVTDTGYRKKLQTCKKPQV